MSKVYILQDGEWHTVRFKSLNAARHAAHLLRAANYTAFAVINGESK
jgi:hypothetical protein